MQTTNGHLNSRTTDREWHFLGEYPPNELMIEMDIQDQTSALFQTIRNMGLHPEHLSNLASNLIEFAKEAMEHLNQEGSESPVYIRLFCQKTTMEEINSAKSSSQFTEEQTSEPSHIIRHFGAGIDGGWGYFLIKRGGNESEDAYPRSQYFIDLYLYREG
jgi:hypothetical protein